MLSTRNIFPKVYLGRGNQISCTHGHLVRRYCCSSQNRDPLMVKGEQKPKVIKKILIANRGEVAIRVSRACRELGIQPLGIYSEQDRESSFRQYMDASFMVGKSLPPVAAYLNIAEILCVAQDNGVDAIHPGYGFLSESEEFAREVIASGIEFIGPRPDVLRTLGDKNLAREAALAANVPIIPGTTDAINDVSKVREFCAQIGFPVILKAAFGGGGKGMRMVSKESEIEAAFQRAQSEAVASFGKGAMLVEKYIEKPRHIEVQILGDKHGNVVHLYERDCSLQRRFQKVIQVAPAQDLDSSVRDAMTHTSVKLAKSLGYSNAGTIEFLVDARNQFYFIEVNPRLQVEHTLSEEITSKDVVEAQINIAQGKTLHELGLSQENISVSGCAIQCHLRSEDPEKNFQPSTGRLDEFISPEGLGVRVDSSTPYSGMMVSPDYDSLMGKVIIYSSDFTTSCQKMRRALLETKVSGVKTNIPFLLNVLENEQFLSGKSVETNFIDDHPELLLRKSYDHTILSQKILRYLGEVLINGPKTTFFSTRDPATIDPNIEKDIGKFLRTCSDIQLVRKTISPLDIKPADRYSIKQATPYGFRNALKSCGAKAFLDDVRKSKQVLLMDTTFRDAHQSLLAARVRTYDLKKISPFVAHRFNHMYALEMWGGFVSQSCLEYLHECPWDRLVALRELIPNIPFLMLLRGNNLVGYSNYSTAEVASFCRLAMQGGIDIFRVFDPMNDVRKLVQSMNTIHQASSGSPGSIVVEATICYAGDITDPARTKYTLEYYAALADQLVASGADVLCLKDMAGLLKPRAASELISLLREKHPGTLLHLHTHDSAGTGVATTLAAAESGADVVDVAADSMSGFCSQPSFGSIAACLENTEKTSGFDLGDVAKYSIYWEKVRAVYSPFDTDTTHRNVCCETYLHEIPGGQYTTLLYQSKMMGVDFNEVKKAYREASRLLGDIIKVHPVSEVVGDLAMFMCQQNLTVSEIEANAKLLTLPTSVVKYFQGAMGEPYGGFPEPLKSDILFNVTLPKKSTPKVEEEISCELQFDAGCMEDDRIRLNTIIFPKETKAFLKFRQDYGPVDKLPTRIFLSGPHLGEEIELELEKGFHSFIRLVSISPGVNEAGERTVLFTNNGMPTSVLIKDEAHCKKEKLRSKADPDILGEVGAPMPGKVVDIKVTKEEEVVKGDVLVVMSVMKMETQVQAPADGKVKEILIQVGSDVQQNDLILILDIQGE